MTNSTWPKGSRFAALVLTVVHSACGGGTTETDNILGGTAPFTANIDGATWAGQSVGTSAIATPTGTFTLSGTNSNLASPTGITLTLYHIGTPGTYPMGVGPSVPGGSATIVNNVQFWSTPLSGDGGTVNVTAVSSSRITGTFSFVAQPLLPATGNSKVVTNGVFNLPVTSSGPLAVPEKNGSIFNGTLAGSPWNAATIVMVVSPSSGIFTVGASNTTYNVNMTVSGYTGAGTYTMNTGVARYFTVTSLIGGTKLWGGSNNLSNGTVNVTSSTANRVKGTFNVTLQPGIVSPGPTAIVFAGAFDVGVP